MNELPTGLAILNQNKDIVYINNQFQKLLGCESDSPTFLSINQKLGHLCAFQLKNKPSIQTIQSKSQNANTLQSVLEAIEKKKKIKSNYQPKQNSRRRISIELKLFKKYYTKIVYDQEKENEEEEENSELENQVQSKDVEIKIQDQQFKGELCFVILMEDLTDRKALQQANENSEFKTKLLQSFSHELKTPLNGGLIPLQLCMGHKKCPKSLINEYLIYTECSLLQLQNQLNDIVDFSLLSSNQFSLDNFTIKLSDFFEQTLKIVKINIQTKGLKLIEYIDPQLPDSFKTDPLRLKQIIINLINNAIKYTNKGTIEFRALYQEIGIIEISIIDQGIGMTKEQQTLLSKFLENCNLTQSTLNIQGIGLGLTISQNLALILGPQDIGRSKGIFFESQLNVGSKFSFEIQEKF